MKRFTFLIWLLAATVQGLLAQVPSYYNDVNLSLRGMDLKNELATKIINTHTHHVSYSELWNVYRHTDSSSPGKIYLIYGWEDGHDSDCHNDLERDTAEHGGSAARCEYNREHVYPKSLGDPPLGTSGAGSDAHHVRPSDVQLNSHRGNKKFADASGHAGPVNDNYWYPGDEWKGDVARIIMYLYLRYGTQCLPRRVGTGPAVDNDRDMLQLFLKWNAEDPPSPVEDKRNEYLEGLQGNRNPFIDNPYLATLIWGGPRAEDRWNMAVDETTLQASVRVWPVPARQQVFVENLSGEAVDYTLYDADGKQLWNAHNESEQTSVPVARLRKGVYFLVVTTGRTAIVRRIVKD